MYQIIAYIKFLLKSTNQHGVHSPFVYDFITKCLYDKTKYKSYSDLKAYRNQLLESKEVLEITDFGAGSKCMGNSKRHVSKMVKISSSNFKDTKLLFRISLSPPMCMDLFGSRPCKVNCFGAVWMVC